MKSSLRRQRDCWIVTMNRMESKRLLRTAELRLNGKSFSLVPVKHSLWIDLPMLRLRCMQYRLQHSETINHPFNLSTFKKFNFIPKLTYDTTCSTCSPCFDINSINIIFRAQYSYLYNWLLTRINWPSLVFLNRAKRNKSETILFTNFAWKIMSQSLQSKTFPIPTITLR